MAKPITNTPALGKYFELDQRGAVQAEYIWVDAGGLVRSKTKTIPQGPVKDVNKLPVWNFDGSSTGDAEGHDSEVYLKPAAIFPDPFRLGDNILVLCECLKPNGEPIESNTRHAADEYFEKVEEEVPWFGIEQEYTLLYADGRTPVGWPMGGYPAPQGPYYCGVGTGRASGREIVEAHYRACLHAGIKISGINAEVMAGQWEYQVGPCEGIESGDHVWLSRYLLHRVAEEFGAMVSLDPKPVPGDWNGAGAHVNFSTKSMREQGGYKVIIDAIKNLEKAHKDHMTIYGEGNERRCTGQHETASYHEFTYGVANRGASVRIPRDTERDGCGYFEDRRPASNMDPYLVTRALCSCALGHTEDEKKE